MVAKETFSNYDSVSFAGQRKAHVLQRRLMRGSSTSISPFKKLYKQSYLKKMKILMDGHLVLGSHIKYPF